MDLLVTALSSSPKGDPVASGRRGDEQQPFSFLFAFIPKLIYIAQLKPTYILARTINGYNKFQNSNSGALRQKKKYMKELSDFMLHRRRKIVD